MTTTEKPGRSIFRIIAIVLVTIVVVGVGMFLFFSSLIESTEAVADAGDAFLQAVSDDDYTAAYAMVAPSMQETMGGEAGLRERFIGSGLVIATWDIRSRTVREDYGEVSGDVTLERGSTLEFEIIFDNVGEEWLVSGFTFE